MPITEDAVLKAQMEFEEKLQNETEFPGAISGQEVYIYWNLMNVWFNKLSAENRYNDEMTQKLRNDWLDYMEVVGDSSEYNWLSLESHSNHSNETKDNVESDSWRKKHIFAARKMLAIRDAFAVSVGQEAVNELAKVQALKYEDFSRFGKLAPDGFKWDLGQRNLVPKKDF